MGTADEPVLCDKCGRVAAMLVTDVRVAHRLAPDGTVAYEPAGRRAGCDLHPVAARIYSADGAQVIGFMMGTRHDANGGRA